MILSRKLGGLGLEVTVIGTGTMSWPGCRYGESGGDVAGLPAALAMVSAAVESGISLIDTAEGYGRGFAEELLGKALKELQVRDAVTIVTKTGPLFAEEKSGDRTCNLSRDHLFERVERSLGRLNVDRLDVLLAHWPDSETPMEATMAAVDELRMQGKIAFFGVSNFPNDLLARALACGPVICNQLPFSLADRSIDDGRRQFCLENGVGIMAYSPIGKGVLSGKYDPDHLPPSGDYRHERPHFRENLDTNLALAERVRILARELQTIPVAVALAWTLLQPGITMAIPGAKTPDQIREHALASSLISDPNIAAKIHELV
jgi:aryl-alcohol dehydrogenase-like predicted oxidoreductase